MPKQMHYSDYLQLEKLLDAQAPESWRLSRPAHDEMLFIVIHQAYELWFKQLLFEIESVIGILKKPSLNDNSPELQTVVHRLSRCNTILKVLVQQIDVMETMTPMDFLEFRDMLRPASGFQSWQFKELEARLGLRFENRYGQDHYLSQLRQPEVDRIKKAEADKSVLDLVNAWLERMPFFDEVKNWEHFETRPAAGRPDFWTEYRVRYQESLAEAEQGNLQRFDTVFGFTPSGSSPAPALSPRGARAALFIMLYRGYPILQLPFQLITQLLEIDEQLGTWRYRHVNMVQRMIGTRIGTGGSSGQDYLRAALDRHYIFREFAQLTSFLIERHRLPALSREMEARLGFAH